MKEGDLVKVLFENPKYQKENDKLFAYGILTNNNPETGLDGYKEVWLFKYPSIFGDMPAQKSLYVKERITHIKTFEDW